MNAKLSKGIIIEYSIVPCRKLVRERIPVIQKHSLFNVVSVTQLPSFPGLELCKAVDVAVFIALGAP
jgi:hypothetical protein